MQCYNIESVEEKHREKRTTYVLERAKHLESSHTHPFNCIIALVLPDESLISFSVGHSN